jgi:hypothetical protein
MSNIVLNGDNWIITRVCNYLIGQDDRNVNIWRRKFNDQFLHISCEEQDNETIFITINKTNTFVKMESIVTDIVDKLEKTIILMQERFSNQDIPMISIYRKNGYKTTNLYTNGICESSSTVNENENIPYETTTDDFPPL